MAKKKTVRTTETAPLKWSEAQNLLKLLKADGDHEGRLMFAIGFYTGLRISDILALKWEVLWGPPKEFTVIESKTGKARKIQVHGDLAEIVKDAKGAIKPAQTDFVFRSRRGVAIGAPLTVVGANFRIKEVFEKYGISTQNASSHCLRKTFARRVYDANKQSEAALILLSKILNHASPAVTRQYIGLTSEVVADAYLNL